MLMVIQFFQLMASQMIQQDGLGYFSLQRSLAAFYFCSFYLSYHISFLFDKKSPFYQNFLTRISWVSTQKLVPYFFIRLAGSVFAAKDSSSIE